MTHLRINILTNKNSWMNQYNECLKNCLEALGHEVKCVFHKKDLSQCDISFFLSYFEIINKPYLELSEHNIVVHASDLPRGKGWSPMTWQILEGKNRIPITLFEACESVDAGKYYIKDEIVLNGTELIDELHEKLGLKIVNMCLNYVQNFLTLKGKEQSGVETFYQRRKPEDSKLDINKTIKEQFNLLRIVDNNYYPAFFEYNGYRYKIQINKVIED